MTTSTADRLRETLEALGVEYAFGYPGGRVIELFESIGHADSPITVVRPRDEREASVMAEAYGRLTGNPGVLMGQGPWIGSLGAIGQMEARLGSSPMVVLTEASERGEYSTLAPYQQSRGDYGGLSLPKILDGITKEWWFPRTPAETIRSTQLAFKHATAGRNGPCAVILDGNAIAAAYPDSSTPQVWEDDEQVRNWRARPTDDDLSAAREALSDADRPVILAGNGVHAANAYDELVAVANVYDAAVATSYLGKSTIPETHPRAAGVVGSFGHEGANRVVSEADVLLVVGCRLNPMDTNWGAESFVRPDEQTILHADVDTRNAGWVYPADVGLIGDAKESLGALAERGRSDERPNDRTGPGDDSETGPGDDETESGNDVENGPGDDVENGPGDDLENGPGDDLENCPGNDGTSWALERAAAAQEDFHVPECDSDAFPIKPQRVPKAIEAVLGENTVVTADSGNNRFWLLNYLQVSETASYYGSGGVGAMGWATPAAVTASLLGYDAIAVAGDGGFTMTMTAVETAVDLGVAPTFVVLNDRSLGMVRQMDEAMPGVEFHDTDFVAIARAMGGAGVRVDAAEELESTIREATEADVPTVVDVPIDRQEAMADHLSSSFYDEVGGLHE